MSELELDPEQLFVEDPNAPDVRDEGEPYDDEDGHQVKPESEVEEETATEDEESQEAIDGDPEDDGDPKDSDSEEPNAEPEAGDVFEVGGKEYTLEALAGHIDDLERGSLRQSDYTKKTQELADSRKGLQSNVDLVSALQKADLMKPVMEALEDAGVSNAQEMVNNVINGVVPDHPDSIELESIRGEREAEVEEKNAEKALQEEIDAFAKRKGIDSVEAQNVRKFAEDRFNEDGVALPLEDAYDLYRVRSGKLSVKRKQPSIPKTPSKKAGGKPPTEEYGDRMEASKLFI